ncbi:MAG: FAD-dependent monooxygenase [Gammaproteobacteria bacterium]|nr:FAD-dependent monooxygenase [Gammaproteobacteria bacterium]MDH5617101.1 FAD-dependent monooxygenase [Gammaproteobacteria bacterium]
MSRGRFTVAGGGPVGSLLAIVLGRHGYDVGLYEGRPDSRVTSIYQGRSINIALSDRGWHSLEQIGISSDAKAQAIPMYHRAIHGLDGNLSALPYGREGDAIWSVSRGGINEQLLDIADAEPNIATHFEHRLVDVDFKTASAVFRRQDARELVVDADYLFGADGAHSKVRRLAHNLPRFSYSQTYMPQSYIELTIPANPDGSHKLEKNALHIWPRKDFMLIALPNADGTFTCTLFLNFSGDPSFESLQESAAVQAFFASNFADAMDYLEDPVGTFLEKTASPLFLVQVFPWSFNRKVGLIGDAAHAIVPFYGQGMNCGFEDCAELNRLIASCDHDWDAIFPAYEKARKPNGDAIAELSKRNFVEMSDLSGDRLFQLRKMIEAKFSARFPELWTPLYSLVTFSPDIPYAEALRIGDEQNRVMEIIMALPNIEDDWDRQYVMDRLHELAVEVATR